jgi:hypothetical protein
METSTILDFFVTYCFYFQFEWKGEIVLIKMEKKKKKKRRREEKMVIADLKHMG